MSDIAKTPKELECKKKYLYEYSMFWECNDGSKCQILEDDVVRLLNEQQATIIELQEIIIDLKDDKNQLHKVISKLRQEVAELKTRNAVLSSKLNQIPESIRSVWIE